MILTGHEIRYQMKCGNISISDFDEKRLNPNSYNLRLSTDLLIYDELVLDPKVKNRYHREKIPEEGYILKPGELYLARTMEHTDTRCYVPMIEGRSSFGRLGLFIHVTAGFGDIGFSGFWTLEMMVHKPLRIYAGLEICQIFYHSIEGHIYKDYKGGKYQNNNDVQPSMIWKEFQ